jgi:hypothetical protein
MAWTAVSDGGKTIYVSQNVARALCGQCDGYLVVLNALQRYTFMVDGADCGDTAMRVCVGLVQKEGIATTGGGMFQRIGE